MNSTGGTTVLSSKGKPCTVMAYQTSDCSTNQMTTGASLGPLPAAGPGECKDSLPAGRSARIYLCLNEAVEAWKGRRII